MYYGHRYYSPDLGRFINRDPIAEQGGLNLYGFCGNDGVDRWDYLGMSWLSKAFRKLEKWTRKHTVGAFLVNLAAALVAPWAMVVTGPLSFASQARQTWQFAQKNPQVAGVIAAIASWYIGGAGAAFIGLGAKASFIVAGATAGFGGGFVGARASGADLRTAFRAGYQGAGLAAVGAKFLHAKYTPFSWASAAHQYVTSEVRYYVGDFVERQWGIDAWAFNGGLLAASFIGNYLVGNGYDQKDGRAVSTVTDNSGNKGIAGLFSRVADSGSLFKNGGIGHMIAEFPFDVVDTLLQYQGLPDASNLKIMFSGWTPKFGHSLGALRYANLAGYGNVSGGNVYALPFGMVAPGGVGVFIGTGDPVTGFSLGKVLNWGANILSVPFGTGHLMSEYNSALRPSIP